MLFNSLQFLIFFPVTVIIYFLLPRRVRWLFLLAASCYFYMAFVPKYILILAATIIVDYFAGIYIQKSAGSWRKFFLICSIVANVGFLAFFKYFNFLAGNINALAHVIGWNYSISLLNIILPIGLSFHTFQAMSYTIEVYRKKQTAERHFGIYALYVMFFPQLVAGPIERPQQLLPQLHNPKPFSYDDVTNGLKFMLWGLFKKVVIADNIAAIIQPVFSSPRSFGGPALIVAVVLFAFQLYTDFSGYSDIAVGAARVFGVRLMFNFNRPYFSKSVAEFWRRWHISLMSWLRDYLYYPLVFSGRHRRRWWVFFSLLFTFFISGLWHGAAWKYVCMGLLNGIYLVVSQLTVKPRQFIVKLLRLNSFPSLHRLLQVMITFGLVCLGWIFFRAESLSSAFVIFSRLTSGWSLLWSGLPLSTILHQVIFFGINIDQTQQVQMVGLFGSLLLLLVFEWIERRHQILLFLSEKPIFVRWFCYYVIVFLILFFGKFGSQQFIYFQF
jgi:alginate O-acetyltransferase complex protein AlgI